MSAKLSKIIEEEEMPKREALLLYHRKGKAGIIKKMASMVGKALSNKDTEFLEWFAEEFELEKEEIEDLKACKKPIDFHFFENVQESLDISTHNVLGEPYFNDGEKRYWSEQLKINPMVLGAPTGDQEEGECPQGRRKIDKEIELRFYVRLRAISELLGNN